MLNLSLVGKGISHSRSQEMYEKIIGNKVNYTLLDFETEDEIVPLSEIFKKYSLTGLSITSPYKEYFLKDVSLKSDISTLNSINCIRRNDDLTFSATNTDFLAVQEVFNHSYLCNKAIYILGDGVMARITGIHLNNLNVKYTHLKRSTHGDLTLYNFSKIDENSLIINACNRQFTFKGKLNKSDIFYDYNYSYPPHFDLSRYCKYIDGSHLLLKQAEHALSFWSVKY